MENETSESWKVRAFAWANTGGSAVVLLGLAAIVAALAGLLSGEVETRRGIVVAAGGLAALGLGRYLAKHG